MPKTDREILNAIEAIESNGLATRSWAVAGLCLGICNRCELWTGSGCLEHTTRPVKFAEMLCDLKFWCDRWTVLHERESER